MGSAHMERLEALLQSRGSAAEPEFKLALNRLSSELHDRRAKGSPEFRELFSAAMRVLSRMRGPAHAETRMTCLFECGLFLYTNGHGLEALEAVRQLDSLANQTKNMKWIRKAGNLSGLVYMDLGNVADAVIRYSKALDVAREIGDVDGEAAVLCNLGGALNAGGFYRESIPCLKLATIVAKRAPSFGQSGEAAALCNMAQSYLYLEEYREGFSAISECLAKSPEPTDSDTGLGRTIREYTYVRLALELGKISSAREHAALCMHYGRLGGGIRSTFIANIAIGLCEIHGGDIDKGLGILENALASSGDTSSFREEALRALVKAYDHACRPERALQCMQKLLAHITAIRERGIVALITQGKHVDAESMILSESHDLRALRSHEADLRAKVAEREVVNSRIEMFERLAVTADLKEEASGEHGYRVGKLSSLLAEKLNWSREACYALDLAARVHDIGKIGVPDRILLNSEELKQAERHFMSTHTIIGSELLAKSNIPQLRMAEEIARSHHEWWNGEGYPAKLIGKRIPLHARIVALADVFDALTHGRPFAKPWPMDQALVEIRSRRGTQFDPELTDVFLELIERLRTEHESLDEFLGKAGRSSPFLQARNKIRLMLAEERENEKMATVAGNETRH
jgi:response regulator RpfG family c-di-GMP phosphodiesterase